MKRVAENEVQRKMLKEVGESRTRLVASSRPLFLKYEERFKQEVEMPILEEKKKQLEDIRNFFRPMERRQIEEHAQRYEQARQIKREESKRVRAQSL